MQPRDFDAVAELIYLSTNSWYQANRGYKIFQGSPDDCRLFCDVYEDLDPGCAMVAEHDKKKIIIGSCFVHPRETHIAIGIVNVHPSYFGDGVAGALMDSVIAFAEKEGQQIGAKFGVGFGHPVSGKKDDRFNGAFHDRQSRVVHTEYDGHDRPPPTGKQIASVGPGKEARDVLMIHTDPLTHRGRKGNRASSGR